MGSGDLLYIKFIYLEDYSTEILVLNDGTVDIPFIGDLNVVGLTLKSAETKIEEALKKELTRYRFENFEAKANGDFCYRRSRDTWPV